MSRSELRDHAKASLDQLAAYSRPPLKARADGFVPDTDDPELIARAKQATDFVNRVGNAANPFAHLSQEELYLIQYDDSKTFSMNEREAAAMELGRRDDAWRTELIANDKLERGATGRGPTFFKTILEDVRSLPPIARALLPLDYEVELSAHIAREERGGAVGDVPPEPLDLMSYLFPEGVEPDEKFRYKPLEQIDAKGLQVEVIPLWPRTSSDGAA